MEKQLLDSPFWNKKIELSTKTRDVDKDGVLTLNDFELVLKRFAEVEGMQKERIDAYRRHIEALCEKVGLKSPSDTLSYDAVKNATAKMADNPQRADNFTDLFSLLDIDGDGDLSFGEWQTYYKCIGIDTAHAKASFDAMDKNGDGSISRDEFIAYHCEFFFSTENTLNSAILFGPLD